MTRWGPLLAGIVAGLVVLGAPVGSSEQRPLSLVVTDDEADVQAPTLGNLADGDVLAVSVTGGNAGSRAVVHQCERTTSGFAFCRHGFPVLFDDEGAALFQYQLHDSGECGPTESCVVMVQDDDGPLVYAYLVFGAAAPKPPSISLQPSGPFHESDVVDVRITGSPPGTVSDVAFCDESCSPTIRATAGPDGVATASVTIASRCDDCGIRVVSGPSLTFVDVEFTSPPGPDYSARRLIPLLVLAATLLVVAWRIAVTTDWRPPSEAAVPEFQRDEEVRV